VAGVQDDGPQAIEAEETNAASSAAIIAQYMPSGTVPVLAGTTTATTIASRAAM